MARELDHPFVIAVVGPTGSGKSTLADRLAQQFGSCVISADSMQIYQGLDIGTAKIPKSEQHAPHYGIDIIDLDQPYSVAEFQTYARELIDHYRAQGKCPILCGGTGLYVRGALDVMNFPLGSQVENKMREKWLCYLDENGEEALIEQLKERDALSAELIDPHNHKRVIRALEMWETGDSYYQQALHFKERIPYYDTCYIGLTLPREELYDRINTRVDRMISHGLVEEVRHLKARGLAGTYTAQHAIGYKELFSYLDSQGTLEDAIEEIKKHSRQYAKRQLTWFRGDERIQWIESSNGDIAVMTDRANEIIERFVRGERNEYLV